MRKHVYTISIAVLVFLFIAVELGTAASVETGVSVKAFGAKGDGKTKDTKSIQQAINSIAAAGGGTIYFPAGRYLTGTIEMKSLVTLRLDSGAVILGSQELNDYPDRIPAIRSYTDNYVKQSLIAGEGLHDIAITGRGLIDGQGSAFKWKEYLNRPYIIRLVNCKNILIEGVTMKNSAMWMQHYLVCENLTIRGITVENLQNYNNDGIDIDSCRDVKISDCSIVSDDDALCLKSTTQWPCKNVTIQNCVLTSHCNALKMGTESNGGFQNITISNCAIEAPQDSKAIYGQDRGLAGIALEIVDGGIMDRVTITNIAIDGVTAPIFIRLGNRARPFKADMSKPKIGRLQNVTISNIIATHASKVGCSITGLPGYPIEGVSLSNIRIIYDGGGAAEDATRAVEELPEKYPESVMFGVLPAYGFFCRHIRGLTLDRIEFGLASNDERPAFIFDDVQNLNLRGYRGFPSEGKSPVIVLNDTQNVQIQECSAAPNTETFLYMQGEIKKIIAIGNDCSQAITPFKFAPSTQQNEFFQTANCYLDRNSK